MKNLKRYVTTRAMICLLACAALLFVGCGDDGNGGGGGGSNTSGDQSSLNSSLKLTELNESQKQTLCQDMQAIGDCTDSDNSATATLSAPDDCDEFSANMENFSEQDCNATVGDATTCQADCSNSDAECGRLMECVFSAQQ